MNAKQPSLSHSNLTSLAGASWLAAHEVQAVLRVLDASGFRARVVGGAVRNTLLDRPVADIDVATTALPEQVIATAEAAGFGVVATGLQHGTVTVVVNRHPIEVTTLREDVETDGRHAKVRFTDVWKNDAKRRDFTINALYCDAEGVIFDPLGGQEDIALKRVRFIGSADDRIREDYLRILRFFRFFAEYGQGAIDQTGLAACIRQRTGLRTLSGERVSSEFLKLLKAPRALAALEKISDHGLWGEFFPTVPRLSHLARLSGSTPNASASLRLACMTIGIDEDVSRIVDRLRLSNAEAATARNAARLAGNITPPTPSEVKAQIYAVGNDDFLNQVYHARSSSFRQLANPDWLAAIRLARSWTAPEFPISGRDALTLGLEPGPDVGLALKAVEQTWIASSFALSRNELLELLESEIKNIKTMSKLNN